MNGITWRDEHPLAAHQAANLLRHEARDARYSQHADRIVHLFDGLIVEEEAGGQRLAAERELKQSDFEKYRCLRETV